MRPRAGFRRKSKAASEIPAASLADMAFLLLIFFMVSTTFRKEQRRQIVIPQAEATRSVDAPRKNILHVYVERDGQVYINDANVPMTDVSTVVSPLFQQSNRQLIVVVRADTDAPYRFIHGVQRELQEANAVRVTFYTNLERRVLQGRR
jgi:biopolymer transport protein ExbD